VADVDVSRLIDDRGINRFNLRLTAIAFLVVLIEGYDVTVLAFALPGLVKAWGITNASALGPLLSASLIGMMIGAPLGGYLGDRFGRRWPIIAACLVFGAFTWLVLLAGTVEQIFYLRFLAGIGLGGVMPNAIALVSEYAPTRKRATMVTVMITGIGFGGAIPGVLSSLLLPRHGWEALFVGGGILPIGIAAVCVRWLPESVKYLVVRARREEAIGILRVLAPNVDYGPDRRLVIADEAVARDFAFMKLFRGGYGAVTLLLWIVAVCFAMTYFFLVSWTPALLVKANFTTEQAALAQSIFQLGGVTGGLILARQLDIRGPMALVLLSVLSVPATAAIGAVGMFSLPLLFITEFVAGFCLLGISYGLGALSAMIYPTPFRSNGAGWASGVGRIGSILGPVLGGILVGTGIDIGTLLMIAAAPLIVSAVACFGLARLHGARFRSIETKSATIFEASPSN
jgi:AAHS family 4-hydroxybenzoate transporter-like MFS transporter